MSTIILGTETANLPLGQLLQQVDTGGIEVRDQQGNVVAFVLSPVDHQAWVYSEAQRDLEEHPDELRQALGRRGGASTAQLLENTAAAAQQANHK
ncbi:MAG: hypothetical protein WD851_12665 [Pirellulales bacterium]